MNDWSLDELLRGKFVGPHAGSGSGHGRGDYDPNQPRVPAGHTDGGQWTKLGAHTRTATPIAGRRDHEAVFGVVERDVFRSDGTASQTFERINYAGRAEEFGTQPSVEVQRLNAVGAEAYLARRRYAELGRPSAEDERAVEETTEILTKLLVSINGTVSRVPGLTARLHGILVHTEFAIAVKALKLPPHLRNLTLQVEQSFDQLGSTRYGQPGSIRTDVILRNAGGVIIAIYDVKTGDAEMRPSTEQKYREYTKVNPSVPLIILRARRGQR
jgi:hypothetical protein